MYMTVPGREIARPRPSGGFFCAWGARSLPKPANLAGPEGLPGGWRNQRGCPAPAEYPEFRTRCPGTLAVRAVRAPAGISGSATVPWAGPPKALRDGGQWQQRIHVALCPVEESGEVAV